MNRGRFSAISALVLGVAALSFASAVIIPFVVAVLCAIFLDPWITRLENRGFSRTTCCGIVLVGFLSVTSLCGWQIYRASSIALDQAPLYLQKFDEFQAAFNKQTDLIIHRKPNSTLQSAPPSIPLTESLRTSMSSPLQMPVPRLIQDAERSEGIQKVQIVEGLSTWRGVFLHFLGSAFAMMTMAFFVPLLSFYLLVDKSNLVESFNTLVGPYCYLPKTNTEIPKMIQTFFKGNLIGAVALFFLHWGLFRFLDLNHAGRLALASAPLNLIPIFGTFLALLLPLSQAIVQWSVFDLLPFAFLLGGITLIHIVIGNVLIPNVVGSKINVNSATLLLGLLFWGWIWGAIGFLLAIPLTAAIKIGLESNRSTRSLSNLMAAKPRHVLP